MGSADVVPGVSGGTIAFITGIYDTLIGSIRNLSTSSGLFFRGQFREWWSHINGGFLLCLLSGILTSLIFLSHLIDQLLKQHPTLLWGFFFGLIIASCIILFRALERKTYKEALMCCIGIIVAYSLTLNVPMSLEASPLLLVGAGAIAICAMILPGLSGSFLLLLMGLYETIISAIKSFDVVILASFMGGCILGLLSFSHVVAYLLKHYRSLTLATLTGFMIGALPKVWPWQKTLVYRINSDGEQVPVFQTIISPSQYEVLTQSDAQVLWVVGLMLLGFLCVMALEFFANDSSTSS